jgi:hypothetical protein
MSVVSEPKVERIRARTVLLAVLAAHPVTMTDAEVLEALACDQPTASERNQVKIGIRELLSIGLLHREDGSLVPTPAALFLGELLTV